MPQVELYAEFEPDRLLQFLAASQSYPLEPALAVAQDRGLIREQARVRCEHTARAAVVRTSTVACITPRRVTNKRILGT